jgi:hypothetical protein
MKKQQLIRPTASFVLALTLLAGSYTAHAQDDDILATKPKFKPKGALTSSYTEKLLTIPGDPAEPGEPRNPPSYEVAITKKLTASATGSIAGLVDIATFNAETPVHFGIDVGGSFAGFDYSLGEDPAYKPGKSKKATFPFKIPDPKDENGEREIKVGAITFTWTATTLSAVLTSTDPDTEGPVEAYLGLGEVKGKAVPFNGSSYLELGIAEALGSRSVVFKGTSKFTVTTKGRGDEAEEFELQSASLVGAFDFKPPVLKSTVPANVDSTIIDLELVYIDDDTSGGVIEFSISVNGQDADYDEVEIDNVTATPGRTTIQISGLLLDAGTNKVVFTATDYSGNVSKVTKTIKASD